MASMKNEPGLLDDINEYQPVSNNSISDPITASNEVLGSGISITFGAILGLGFKLMQAIQTSLCKRD
ncbi:hypothetical protein AC249_AIPGENE18888 [Exaiptasia diaphana]|nr:hypothetical protein AC249_AIPGENE18888 [Exaiptasia diaphana]